MFLKKLLCVAVCVLFLTGCSKQACDIGPTYVSPLTYDHYSCDQIRQELLRVNHRVMEVTGQQDDAATKDAAAMTVGLVLFWPALFFMAGGDKKEELGRLKGEYEALEKCAIEKECDVTKQVREARLQREAYEKKRREMQEDDEENRYND